MRSQNKPEEIMAEVYRTMQALNFVWLFRLDIVPLILQQWKTVNPFHTRCRVWNQVSGAMVCLRPYFPSHHPQIKMSLQLYSVEDNTFLLDFRHLPTRASERLCALGAAPQDVHCTAHTLEFFELCALFISVGRQ